MEGSAKVAKMLLDSIETFNGHQSRFESWVDRSMSSFEVCSPLIAQIINGKELPSEIYGHQTKVDQHGGFGGAVGGQPSPPPSGSVTASSLAPGALAAAASPPSPVGSTAQSDPTPTRETVSAKFERIAREAATAAMQEQKQPQP